MLFSKRRCESLAPARFQRSADTRGQLSLSSTDLTRTPLRRRSDIPTFLYGQSDVECWPRSEREMYATWMLSKPSVGPNCASTVTHRVRRKGLLEQIFRAIFLRKPAPLRGL
jgi:hypothetical protein